MIDKIEKYKFPEEVDKLDEELRAANTELFHLIVAKQSNQPEAEYLDGILEDSYAHLAETCERILFNIDDYFKNK